MWFLPVNYFFFLEVHVGLFICPGIHSLRTMVISMALLSVMSVSCKRTELNISDL